MLKVLDHGFVRIHNIAGPVRRIYTQYDAHDVDPAITARMSFNNFDKERTEAQDLKLVEYLMKNRHSTPIEMIEIWIEMKLPIFVARQFVRHRTVTINEVSARYVTLPAEWYIPEVVGGKAPNAKQGQEDNLDLIIQRDFKQALNEKCEESYRAYLHYIGMGIAPEHARMFLHMNHYTHWIWKQDMHNMMHFLSLRDHSHAQIESQMYAEAITKLLHQSLPNLIKFYEKYRKQV